MMGSGWWRGVLWLMLVGLGLYVFTRITGTLTIFGLGFVIAYLLNSPVEKITGQKLGPIKSLSRGQAILAVYLFLFALLTAGGFLIIPLAIEQTQEMVHDAPEMVARIQTKAFELQERYIHSIPPSVRSSVESTIAGSADRFGSVLGTVLTFLATAVLDLVGKVFLLLTGLLVALYFLLNWHGLFDSALGLVPRRYKDDARSLTLQMNRIFGGYIRATIVASSACGVVTFALLMLLAAWHPNPYSLLLALLAALTYPIPVVGAAGTCVLGGVMAFLSTGDVGYAVMVLLAIMAANQGVDRTIYPKLMGDAIGVSPMFILFAAFAGGEFLGTTGMLLGIPLAAMTKALLTWFHARFLVIPEEQQRHSTEELWARAAARAGQAAPATVDQAAWDEAAQVAASASARPAADPAASSAEVAAARTPAVASPAVEQAAATAAPAVEASSPAAEQAAATAAPAVEASSPAAEQAAATAAPPAQASSPAVEQAAATAGPAVEAPSPAVEQAAAAAAPAVEASSPVAEQAAATAALAVEASSPAAEQATATAGPAVEASSPLAEQAAAVAEAADARAGAVAASQTTPSVDAPAGASATPEQCSAGAEPARAIETGRPLPDQPAPLEPKPSSDGVPTTSSKRQRQRQAKKEASAEPPVDEEGGIVGMIG